MLKLQDIVCSRGTYDSSGVERFWHKRYYKHSIPLESENGEVKKSAYFSLFHKMQNILKSKELEPGLRKLKMDELNRISVEAFKESGKTPVAIVLDNVRSALNVGSVFRTADAFAVAEIVLCGITAQPPHREILKTALGSTESVEWSYAENITEVLERLKAADYIIAAVEQAEGSVGLHEVNIDPEQKYALIFGNEVDGVSDEAIRLSDLVIEIPQFGTKHSLNIAVSAGIVIWEFARKLKQF